MTTELITETVEMLVTNYFNDQVTRERIEELESILSTLPQLSVPLGHHFAKGLYARTIVVPAGFLGVGKLHVHSHFCMLVEGSALVLTEHGPVRIDGPYFFVSHPGTKRVVFALAKTVWTTIHATEETDIDRLEDELFLDTYAQYEDWKLTHDPEPPYPQLPIEEGNLAISPRVARRKALCQA